MNELKKTIETEFNISVWSCNVSSSPPVGALNLHIRFQSKFNVPVHPDSQLWFAFEFESRGYTFPRMPQGYRETSTIYNDAFRTLEPLALTEGTALQYIGDLMVCSPTREQCETDTVKLLKHLTAQGHKASLSKLQFVQQKVTFLGHDFTAGRRSLSSKRVRVIQNFSKPRASKQINSFLGIFSFCRTFIPNYMRS